MPALKRLPDRSWIRPAYRAADYTITPAALALLQACPYGTLEELGKPDGLYGNYDRLAESELDGKRFARVVERSKGWLLDIELTAAPPAEIRAVDPAEAWVHARTRDTLAPSYVPFEGEPPPGIVDPNPRPAS